MNNITEKLTGSLYALINGMLRLQSTKFLCLKVVCCVECDACEVIVAKLNEQTHRVDYRE